MDQSEDQSFADDSMMADRDMTNEQKRRHDKRRNKKGMEHSIEQSAPNETKSDTGDNSRDERRRRDRDHRKHKGLKDRESTKLSMVDTTFNEESRKGEEKKDLKQEDVKSNTLTAAQIIAKNLTHRPEEKQRKSQLVGFNTIRLITKIMHLQKEKLGLKLTGD